MLNELVYCPRLFHLEWAQAEWDDSADTLAGKRDHRRVDRAKGGLPEPELLDTLDGDVRSLSLSAPEEGLIAVMDLVEFGDGLVVPVDTKHGAPPASDAVWPADRIQIGAQALILRANGYPCERGIVYYVKTRRRIDVACDEQLIADVREAVRTARTLAATMTPPPPLVESPKCPGCSLVGICLPDETNLLRHEVADSVHEVRPLSPRLDDALPVFVQSNGARVGKRGDELEVKELDGSKTHVRVLDTSQVCLFGNVQMSTQALQHLMSEGIPVVYFSSGGWFYGVSHGLGNRNADLRLHQYRVVSDEVASLELSKGFIERKIWNARTLLRRNHVGDVPAEILRDLKNLSEKAREVTRVESLLGIEGTAARIYFANFTGMFKSNALSFSFEHRNRRPPRDPVNALLSLAYSILAKDWTITLFAVGLDPYLGFFHRPRFGRPALALDLMEEFRPLIADSVVLQLLNNGEVRPGHFVQRGQATALTSDGRRKFFQAYERRMQQLVTHPLFRYRISYRRLLEVQARLLSRKLSGEHEEYLGLRVR